MLTRRQFLTRNLHGASLLAAGTVVPQFVANTARAATPGKDSILLVIELNGGNDGLNTVIPYADDNYRKARPTLNFKKGQVIRLDDHVGLHPALRGLDQLRQQGQLAVVQGVGYPNPDRSHFESMDIWQSAEVGRKLSGTGWLARSVPNLGDAGGSIPALQVGPEKLPLALRGAASGVVSINNKQQYQLNLGGKDAGRAKARKQLLTDLAQPAGKAGEADLLQFVQRRQLQTYAHLDRLQDILRNVPFVQGRGQEDFSLYFRLQLISQLIAKDFGTRVYYVSLGGFDTHASQAEPHRKLMQQLGDALSAFFSNLKQGGHDKRVVALTFSEFGRRINENGSNGTDHGTASCLFVAGPAVRGGVVGKHPSLTDTDLVGDMKFHTDFRRVYATLLDRWLACDSKTVLGDRFEPLDLIKKG